MSKKCMQCGAELEDNALFCDECGAQQATPETTASVEGHVSQTNAKIPSTNQIVKSVEGLVDRIPINSGNQSANLSPDIIKPATGRPCLTLGSLIAIIPITILKTAGITDIPSEQIAIIPKTKEAIPPAEFLIMSGDKFAD